MKLFDITVKLDENTPIYEGDPKFSVEAFRVIDEDGYHISKLRMGSHSGTHIDAPEHYVRSGKRACDLPLKSTVGPCVVLDRIDDYKGQADKILLRHGHLTLSQAEKLIDAHVTLVGTVHMSIGEDDVHQTLLKNECVILEKLDLSKVENGNYFLSAAPLKIEADGSPVRAFLARME